MLRACSHLELQARGRDYKYLKAYPSDVVPQARTHLPKLPQPTQIAPPIGVQVFKHKVPNGGGGILIQPSTALIPTLRRLWEAGERLSPVQSQATW